MATSTVACNFCSVRHITKSSAVWCSECDKCFCTDCKEYHSLAKATRDPNKCSISWTELEFFTLSTTSSSGTISLQLL
jgi:Fe2+ or Zn2+ uptake regulation protein